MKDYSKCPKCGQQIYIIVGDSNEGWYKCYEANPDLSQGAKVEIEEGSRLDRSDEVEDVVHYTCEIGLAGIESDACNKVYCTSKEELINLFEKSNNDKTPPASTPKNDRKPNEALTRNMTPSKELAAVIGSNPMRRTEVTSKLWAYIKEHNLQDPNDSKLINADSKLQKLFDGKKQVTMFEMTALVSKHLS